MNRLEPILAATRDEVARRREALPVAALERAAAARAAEIRPFAAALSSPGISLIAEHKRRSPSAGAIREGTPIEAVVDAYECGGAAALSVLTDGPSFGGSLADLDAARAAASLPILRKDFIVDRYQVPESAAAGADAILLIVAALSAVELAALHADAVGLGLTALVEVHDERELEAAAGAGAAVIGINNRDLATLSVHTDRTFELLPLIPPGALVVAESGFRRRDELERLEREGVDAVLVGEALMGAADIESAVRELSAAASAVRPPL
jgi:indole-3-glycerol phosphate synthase